MKVFVRNQDGAPLMPCTPAKARKLLRAGRARVVAVKGCHHPSPYLYKYRITGSGWVKLRTRSIQPTPS
jgi:hypothetical protein